MNFRLIEFQKIGDNRGALVSLESQKNIPFKIKRVYYIFDTVTGVSRGYHAHFNLEQVVLCVKGSVKFAIDDGTRKKIVNLDKPNIGLYLKGLLWREMHDFSEDCVLLVLASDYYDESDYIRDYDQFMAEVAR